MVVNPFVAHAVNAGLLHRPHRHDKPGYAPRNCGIGQTLTRPESYRQWLWETQVELEEVGTERRFNGGQSF